MIAELPTAGVEHVRPMREVSGKTAFITGGSSGIGLGIAHACAESGMKVAFGYQTKKHLDEAMQFLAGAGDRIHAISVDVTDRQAMERAAQETVDVFGKVHVLINNAGVFVGGSLGEASYNDWDWMMNVNLTGVFNGVQAFLPHIRAHGEGGQIVSTASAWGLIAVNGAAIYCASKAAVIMLMEALRAELADGNVGVSVYCPGGVDTNIGDSARASRGERTASGANSDTGSQLMDPLEAGQWVLHGIRNNDLYIFSHPEYRQGIRDRGEALLASMPSNVTPPAGRVALEGSTLNNPIYALERDRKLHAQPHS
jgi:NADP-dependent 3-hydroxy acid dehydrogenase YdfG